MSRPSQPLACGHAFHYDCMHGSACTTSDTSLDDYTIYKLTCCQCRRDYRVRFGIGKRGQVESYEDVDELEQSRVALLLGDCELPDPPK